MPSDDNKKSLQQWQIEQLISDRIKVAIKEYDDGLQEALKTMFIIELSPYKIAYSVQKFVVVAVSLLVIGTLYQLFVSLAKTGIGR